MNAYTVLLCCLALVCVPAAGSAAETPEGAPSVYPELLSKPYLYEVVRHLYRWYMDEADVMRATGSKEFTFWARDLRPKLDPGDRSRLGEIILPGLGIAVRVKQADYTIEELGTKVKNDTFKITNVARVDVPEKPPAGFVPVAVDYTEMRDYLFRTRNRAEFPDEVLLERLRRSARATLLKEAGAKLPFGEQIAHLSPLSPVANELWVFWENGRKLIRFSSDIDLADPAVWDHDELAIRIFDIDDQVVVSLDEVAGSNAYLTRDQVGRALFNCVVLGRRLTVLPPEAKGPGNIPETEQQLGGEKTGSQSPMSPIQ